MGSARRSLATPYAFLFGTLTGSRTPRDGLREAKPRYALRVFIRDPDRVAMLTPAPAHARERQRREQQTAAALPAVAAPRFRQLPSAGRCAAGSPFRTTRRAARGDAAARAARGAAAA